MNLSKHLTTDMASVSKKAKELGISNAIPQDYMKNAIWLGVNIYDPVIEYFKISPIIWALYRNLVINKAVGGALGSWHTHAAAIDLDYDHLKSPTNSQLFYFLVENLKEFEKIIWEMGNGVNPGWVHIQGKAGLNNRIITLAYKHESGKTKYEHFTTLTEFEQFKKGVYGT